MRLFHQPVQTAGPIQERVLRVQMEMNKVRMRHKRNLPVRLLPAQAQRSGKRAVDKVVAQVWSPGFSPCHYPHFLAHFFSKFILLNSELPRPWSSAAATRAKSLSNPGCHLHGAPKSRPAVRRLRATFGWSIRPWVFQSARSRSLLLRGRRPPRPPVGRVASGPASSCSRAAPPPPLTPPAAL